MTRSMVRVLTLLILSTVNASSFPSAVLLTEDFSGDLGAYDQPGQGNLFATEHDDQDYVEAWARDYAYVIDDSENRRLLLYAQGSPHLWQNYLVQYAVSHGDNDQFSLIFYYNNGNYYRLRFETNGNIDDFGGAFSKFSYFAKLERINNGEHDNPTVFRTAVWPASSIHHLRDRPGHGGLEETILEFRVKVVTIPPGIAAITAEYLNPGLEQEDGSGTWVDLFDGEIIVDAQPDNCQQGSVGFSSFDNGVALHPELAGFRAHQLLVSQIDPCIINAGLDQTAFADATGSATVDMDLAPVVISPGACGTVIGYEWFLNDDTSVPFSTAQNPAPTSMPLGLNTVTVKLYGGSTLVDEDSAYVWVSGPSSINLAIVPDPHVAQENSWCGQSSPDTLRTQQVKGILRDIESTREELRVRAVLSMGDLTFRATDANTQAALMILAAPSNLDPTMPFITSTGNHDTGLWLVSCEASSRDTPELDAHIYPIATSPVRGGFTSAKTDGDIRALHFRYSGELWGNRSYSILTLQTSPLQGDLDWLDERVADYPDDILILMTHHMFDEWGTIDMYPVPSYYQVFDDGVSPQGVIDHIRNNPDYKNLIMILSGHTGYGGGVFARQVEAHGKEILVLCTDISFAHLNEGADGQYRLLRIDPEHNKVFSELRYARTHEHVSGYTANTGRVSSCRHQMAEFAMDLVITAKIFADGFESADTSAWSSAVP